jgi:cellobiose transport system permease protein
VIITSTIGGLQIFDEPRMYDQFGTGGANNQWLTITLWLYDLGWGSGTSAPRRSRGSSSSSSW